ncbi:hypothetical protein VTJ83DRAFT_887 [Remersonia thermophila]|uniref:COP9 signalosome complex subunit 5 n=1 Tax=Remersonia thermophila TaxID=72144 RepID=A0ABR4DMG4_9PEZI
MELPVTDKLVDRQRDALFNYSAESQAQINKAQPWNSDVHYFQSVRISPIALAKMVIHARSGGPLEVMGIMQGYVDGTAFVITDAFRLPVEGTETRVNAQSDADEYLIEYLSLCRDESRQENVIGWYHSHPGYGCWLSGIDVDTQQLQQSLGPMVAIVIDPDRTVSSNRVDIGAFRAYPKDYKGPTANTSAAPTAASSSAGSVPLTKVTDFGAHADKYYALRVEHYRSGLDGHLLERLWNKYWVQTLAQNPLLTNRDYATSQMADVAQRAADAAQAVARQSKNASSAAAAAAAAAATAAAAAAAAASATATASGSSSSSGAGSGSAAGALFTSGAGGSAASGSGKGADIVGAEVAVRDRAAKGADAAVDRLTQDVDNVAAKEKAGLMAIEVKKGIFGGGGA